MNIPKTLNFIFTPEEPIKCASTQPLLRRPPENWKQLDASHPHLTKALSRIFHGLLRFLFHIGYFGPLLMGILDSSFLILPFGNDLLVVASVARNHEGYLLYVLMATLGSTIGVALLDFTARKVGSGSVEKATGRRRFAVLKKKIQENGALALLVGCLAPPPFPFTMAVATLSTLRYPRARMLSIVFAGRASRFLLLGFLALRYGRKILKIMDSREFTWTMILLIVICIAGSAYSLLKWFRSSRREGQSRKAAA